MGALAAGGRDNFLSLVAGLPGRRFQAIAGGVRGVRPLVPHAELRDGSQEGAAAGDRGVGVAVLTDRDWGMHRREVRHGGADCGWGGQCGGSQSAYRAYH